MKAAKNIYIVMNVILILTCIGLGVYAMLGGFNVLFLIAPFAALALFLFILLNKSEDEMKNLMKAVFSAHIAVILAVTQGTFAFKMQAGNAIVIIAIAAVLVAFMIISLKKMFKKLAEFSAGNSKEDSLKEGNDN